MQTGKKINQISNRLRRRSRAIQETIGISSPVKYGNAPVAAIVLSMYIWGRKKRKLKSE